MGVFLCAVSPLATASEVQFNRDVRPILSDHCFACHGLDAGNRKGKLRLDTFEEATAARADEGRAAIVPGNVNDSEAWRRILSTDPDEIMPPPETHKPLSTAQKAVLKKWIEGGAAYQEHWAYIPVVRPPVPTIAQPERARNPIDAFILERLDREGLQPVPEAMTSDALRRLSLDLTGLPPNAHHALRPEASYEQVVETLIASPHYGERMAVPWLDVVRFSDTVGYHGDQNQRIFPYRDYVIRAFNTNKPFDVFTREQVAGDLVEPVTEEARVATGFLRLNMVTREGGAQPAEYLAKYASDRVRTVGQAWLGTTTACSECHDHKFDPFSIRDFYAMAAFFGDIQQWGVYSDYRYTPNPELAGWNNDFPFPPEMHLSSDVLNARIDRDRRALDAHLATTHGSATTPEYLAWIDAARSFVSTHTDGALTLVPEKMSSTKQTSLSKSDDRLVIPEGAPRKDDVIEVSFAVPVGLPIAGILLDVVPHQAVGGMVGRAGGGRFSVEPKFFVERPAPGSDSPDATPAPPQRDALAVHWAQANRRTPHKYSSGYPAPELESRWRSGPIPLAFPENETTLPHQAIFHLTARPTFRAEDRLIVRLDSADIGAFSIRVTPFPDAVPGRSVLHRELADALALTTSENAAAHPSAKAAWHLVSAPSDKVPADVARLRREIVRHNAGMAYTLVARSLPSEKRRVTRILPRGDWQNETGEVVQPTLPSAWSKNQSPASAALDRRDLANWLVDASNPLTARHVMNRLWKQFFGSGLSGNLSDLGSQGEWPSHPELLDWLAAEFMESGWDVKHMVRLMVSSAAYRRQAAVDVGLLERDPDSRLLAQMPARRLDAEFIRDNALAIAGLLNLDDIGGPSAHPYQPVGYYGPLNFPEREYAADTNQQQYRRGVYMHWQRTFLHPMLANFDAPGREECTADRSEANSPQQALTLLNDPTFVEAARALADRLLREHPSASPEVIIRRAYALALARAPRDDELASLLAFHAQQRIAWAEKTGDAARLAQVGMFRAGQTLDPVELAAWTQTCRAILNLHETITRY